MKRQRNGNATGKQTYCKDLFQSIGQFLPKRGLPLQLDDGRVRWTPRLLATTAVLASWAVASTCQEAFSVARHAVIKMYPTRRRPGTSYQGFIKALCRQSAELLLVVVSALRRAVEDVSAQRWREDGWVVMGVDGSSVKCPRTAANENAFGYSGKKRSSPQQKLTALFHVATGLPWAWRRGHARADEVGHLREMLHLLPDKTMLLADAYYTTYALLGELTRRGHRFIVRIGSNVHLLRKLGYAYKEHDGIVYLWPKAKQTRAGNDPLVLRLVVVSGGRYPVYLATNVLDDSALSDVQVGQMYRLRWGIELMYRSLKQTLDHSKMRSEAAESARVELDWAMVSLWLLGLMTLGAMSKKRRCRRWSVAKARRAVRTAMGNLPGRRPSGGLRTRLSRAVQDNYQRSSSKASRDRPRKKKYKAPGSPKIRMATHSEVQRAQAHKQRGRAA